MEIAKTTILGVNVGVVTLREIIEIIAQWTTQRSSRRITYVNADCMVIAQKNARYKQVLNDMDLVYAGGMGVVWASLFTKGYLPERVNILDFFHSLAKKLQAQKTRIYLLGARAEVIAEAYRMLTAQYGLDVVGYHHGYFHENEEQSIVDHIRTRAPDLVIVGMGAPRQEEFIERHLHDVSVGLWWAVGGAFNNLSGTISRAPAWMFRNGLEWLYRLCQEPRRLWKRYLIGNSIFCFYVARERFFRRE